MVNENALAGTTVGTLAGQDVDNSALTYSLLNDAGGRFAIDTNTGVVSVANAGLLDFEINASHQITIEVQDAAGLKYDTSYAVNVVDVNEAPHAIAITSPLTIFENSPTGVSVGSVLGQDVDDAALTYSLLDDAGGRFAIDTITGEISVLNGSQLDFETNSTHQITIEVQDAGGLKYDTSYTVNVININDAPHSISITSPLLINENAPAGTSVGLQTVVFP